MYYWIRWGIIALFGYQFVLNVILRFGRYLYEYRDRMTIASMIKNNTRSSTNHIYQSMYSKQVTQYVNDICQRLTDVRLTKLLQGQTMTSQYLDHILRILILNNTDYVPWGDGCSLTHREYNYLRSKFVAMYVMDGQEGAASVVDMSSALLNGGVISAINSVNSNPSGYLSQFNDIATHAEPKSIYATCADLFSYAKVYDAIANRFEIIDIEDRVRLFINHSDSNEVKIYFPYDSDELKQYLDTTDCIIVQIKSIFSWNCYDGSNPVGSAIRNTYEKFMDDDKCAKTKDDVYYDIMRDIDRVFGFIRDTECHIKTTKIYMRNCMTIFAPQIYIRHSAHYHLMFRLTDPVIYAHSYHRIFDTIRNYDTRKLRCNVRMMNALNRLGLIDIYLGPKTMERDSEVASSENASSENTPSENTPSENTPSEITRSNIGPIDYFYTSNIKIVLTDSADKYLDAELTKRLLSTTSKVIIVDKSHKS